MRTASKLILASKTAGPSEVTLNSVSLNELAKGIALARAHAVNSSIILSFETEKLLVEVEL